MPGPNVVRVKVSEKAPADLAVNGQALEAGKVVGLDPHEAKALVRMGHATYVKDEPEEVGEPPVPARASGEKPARKPRARRTTKGKAT